MPLALALVGSVTCAILLHTATGRPDAARVVPITLIWGVAALAAVRHRGHPALWVLAAAAVAVRLPLVGTPPLLSDDLFRYLWEGLALNSGHNPFLEAPATISGLDDTLRDRVNHGEIPSIYPPVAQLWFRALAVLGCTSAVAQAVTAAVDCTTVVSIRLATKRPGLAWVYALHPLAVLESASGAHIDVLALALAAAGVAAARRGSPTVAWSLTVAGGLTKLLPLVWAPVLLRRHPPRRSLLWVAGAAVAAVLLAAPVLGAGWGLVEALTTYSRSWAFNGLLYPWLEPWLGPGARVPLVAAGAMTVVYALWRHSDPAQAWLVIGAAFVLTSPTVHPWYVLWAAVPALLCGRIGWAAASLPLMGAYTVLLAYEPESGTWSEAPWLWWITWPPAVVALAVAYWVRSDSSPTEPYPNANNAKKGSEAA